MQRLNRKTMILLIIILGIFGIGLFLSFRLVGFTMTIYDEGGGLPEDFEEYMQEMYGEDWATPDIPTNPSININDGASTSDSFEVALEISCQNANEMRFRLNPDIIWTNWENYLTFKMIELPEVSDYFPVYKVAVQFRNSYGESEIVWDQITVEIDENPEPPTITPKTTSYSLILIYVIIIVISSVIVIILLLEFTIFKKNKKRGK